MLICSIPWDWLKKKGNFSPNVYIHTYTCFKLKGVMNALSLFINVQLTLTSPPRPHRIH